MLKLESVEDLRNHLEPHRRAGRRIGFVPTMGALHEGHCSLMRAARRDCDVVVVSLFVNPTQFGPGEDFEKYPRAQEADLRACETEGVDVVFTPSVEVMYPPGSLTTVAVTGLTGGLCGVSRLGHFDGVTTVVAKLFNIVQPQMAYFGQKDAQQAVVIRRMARDLFFPLRVEVCPTMREPDGLAMSSRNAYLSAQQRKQALSLSASLNWAREAIAAGHRDVSALVAKMRERIQAAGPCEIEYIECVDADELTPRGKLEGRCLLALAVRIGPARLIDNLVVDVPAHGG